MNTENYINYTTEEFILDTDFMCWVLNADVRSDRFWKAFLLFHPEKKEEMEEAIYIIRSISVVEPEVPSLELKSLHQNSQNSSSHKGIKVGQLLIVAAMIVIVFTVGGLFFFYQQQQTSFSFELLEGRYDSNGKIILPDGTISEFKSKETRIQQTAAGNLTINDDTLRTNERLTTTDETAKTQVIIPYGKRSEIILADGTRIWLNAGSSLSYPVHFNTNKREVHLSGEAFFEVSTDNSKPFYVITNDIKIKVTGTRFNITSYHNDDVTQAVLVEGKIEASKNRLFGQSIELMPGERILYHKEEKMMQKEKVDTAIYSSWVNGYLIIENEPVEEILKKLERYYNQKIVLDKINDKYRFTGKLNLADSLDKVLSNIAFSGSFNVVKMDSLYLIQQ
ncbi:MAG: FecR domain-containing protein [Paludibacter sp.]|nr:FecR domain-containing protein [Paludibacter sp.]